MSDIRLGLYRLMSFADREMVQQDLELSFEDIYDALETLQFEVREFEVCLNTLFHGENHGAPEERAR